MEFDFDQAKSIINDKTNPHYERYHNNDRDVNDAVSRAFVRKYPGEIDLADRTPESLKAGAAPEKAGDDLVTLGNQVGADQVETTLKTEWGAGYEQNLNYAVDALGDVFASADDFQKFLDTENITPAEQIKAVKWLSAIGRGKR
jgi:hypothetical protein